MSERRTQWFIPITPNDQANRSQLITGDNYTHLLCSLSHCKDSKGYMISINPCAKYDTGYKVMITGSREESHYSRIASAARFNAKEFAALKEKVMELTDDPKNPAIADILKHIGYTYPTPQKTTAPENIIAFPTREPENINLPLTARFPFKTKSI